MKTYAVTVELLVKARSEQDAAHVVEATIQTDDPFLDGSEILRVDVDRVTRVKTK